MAAVVIWTPGTLKQPGDLVRPTNSGVVSQPPLDNQSFDDGDTGWSHSGFGSFTIDTADPIFDGTYSMKLGWTDNPNAQTLHVVNDEKLPVTPGQLVTLRMYVISEVTGDYARIKPKINWYGPSPGFVPLAPTELPLDPTIVGGEARINESGLSSAAANGVWVLLEFSGTAPAGAAFWTAAVDATWGDCHWTVDKVSYSYAYTADPNNLIFRATQAAAGFTGNTEPDWPTVIGDTVTDNDVTWEAVSGNSVTWQAHRILVSGDTEPTWPLSVGGAVADNTITWTLDSRRITDTNVPTDSSVVVSAASKIFVADKDIIDYSATVNPLDWSTHDDAGYIPFGLQQYGAKNPVTAMGLYRGNLAAFNSEGCQLWQLDEDPAAIAYLDAIPVSCTYHKSVQPVGDDLAFLSNLGIRSLGMSGSSVNLQGGFFGQQVDPLVVPALNQLVLEDGTPIGLYWPARGQYWLFFGEQAFVLTITGGQNEKKQRSWSRYVFPWAVTDWTIQGTTLILRAGELVEIVDPDAVQDDVHTEVLPYLNLDSTTEYDTAGWLQGASQVVLGATQNYDNETPVVLVAKPPNNPVIFLVTASATGGTSNQNILASFDNALTFTPINTLTAGEIFLCAAFSASRREVLFLTSSGVTNTTTDGVTLNALANNIGSRSWKDMVRNGQDTLYVACCTDGVDTTHRIATSPDGAAWTIRAAPALTYNKLWVDPSSNRIWALAGNASTQPMAYSDDGGLSWTQVAAFGFTAQGVSEIMRSAEGRYILQSVGATDSIYTSDFATFVDQSSVFANGATASAYDPVHDKLVTVTAGGVYTSPGVGVPVWTLKTSTLAYIDQRDVIASFFGDLIGVRPASGSQATNLVVRSSDGGATWSNIQPPAYVVSNGAARIYEFATQFQSAVNTATFGLVTATGTEGTSSAVLSSQVIAPAGSYLILKYPADGPFTPTDGNTVGSLELTLGAGLSLYLKQYSALRITHASGVDWNYLAEDVAADATVLPLLFPLEHVATAVRVLPKGTLFLNSGSAAVGYVALAVDGAQVDDTLSLIDQLPASAAALPCIVRVLQKTTVAGGQGTTHVTLTDVTTFDNDAFLAPEAGFPAAAAVIGPFIEFTTGTDFTGVIHWPFIDMRNPGADKEMIAFDLTIKGECDFSIGYNQNELDYNPSGFWTEAYTIDGDTVPGQPVPFGVTGPTLSMRLEFAPGQLWEWYAANLYVKDQNQ